MKQIVLLLIFACIVVGKFPRLALPKFSSVSTTLDMIAGYHSAWRREEEEKEFSAGQDLS